MSETDVFGEDFYRELFQTMLEGFAFCQMIYQDDQPIDFVYLRVNPAFERLTGLKNVAGRKFSEILPGVKESNPELLKIYSQVALGGPPARFESFSESFGGWLSVVTYGHGRGYFVAVFENITERKKAEEMLNERLKEIEGFNRAAVGREIKMMALEEEINGLLKELGRPPKYSR